MNMKILGITRQTNPDQEDFDRVKEDLIKNGVDIKDIYLPFEIFDEEAGEFSFGFFVRVAK